LGMGSGCDCQPEGTGLERIASCDLHVFIVAVIQPGASKSDIPIASAE